MTAPLRRVVLWSSRGLHILECRHELGLRYTAYGMATDQTRCRCLKCARGVPPDFTPEAFEALLREHGVVRAIVCERPRRSRPAADRRQRELVFPR